MQVLCTGVCLVSREYPANGILQAPGLPNTAVGYVVLLHWLEALLTKCRRRSTWRIKLLKTVEFRNKTKKNGLKERKFSLPKARHLCCTRIFFPFVQSTGIVFCLDTSACVCHALKRAFAAKCNWICTNTSNNWRCCVLEFRLHWKNLLAPSSIG